MNRADGTPFTSDDEYVLNQLCRQLAVAVANCAKFTALREQMDEAERHNAILQVRARGRKDEGNVLHLWVWGRACGVVRML